MLRSSTCTPLGLGCVLFCLGCRDSFKVPSPRVDAMGLRHDPVRSALALAFRSGWGWSGYGTRYTAADEPSSRSIAPSDLEVLPRNAPEQALTGTGLGAAVGCRRKREARRDRRM
jgi:hypothetical protein